MEWVESGIREGARATQRKWTLVLFQRAGEYEMECAVAGGTNGSSKEDVETPVKADSPKSVGLAGPGWRAERRVGVAGSPRRGDEEMALAALTSVEGK